MDEDHYTYLTIYNLHWIHQQQELLYEMRKMAYIQSWQQARDMAIMWGCHDKLVINESWTELTNNMIQKDNQVKDTALLIIK